MTGPRLLKELCQQKIKYFAHSNRIWAALSEDGWLFTWGNNLNEVLGHDYIDHIKTPRLVEGALADKKVVQFSCGSSEALVLTDQGRVLFLCFDYYFVHWMHELDLHWPLYRPSIPIGHLKAVAVACANQPVYVLLEDGQFYS